jgi:hypothetical protein
MHVLTTTDAPGEDASPLPDNICFDTPDHLAQDAALQVCSLSLASVDDPKDNYVTTLTLSFAEDSSVADIPHAASPVIAAAALDLLPDGPHQALHAIDPHLRQACTSCHDFYSDLHVQSLQALWLVPPINNIICGTFALLLILTSSCVLLITRCIYLKELVFCTFLVPCQATLTSNVSRPQPCLPVSSHLMPLGCSMAVMAIPYAMSSLAPSVLSHFIITFVSCRISPSISPLSMASSLLLPLVSPVLQIILLHPCHSHSLLFSLSPSMARRDRYHSLKPGRALPGLNQGRVTCLQPRRVQCSVSATALLVMHFRLCILARVNLIMPVSIKIATM